MPFFKALLKCLADPFDVDSPVKSKLPIKENPMLYMSPEKKKRYLAFMANEIPLRQNEIRERLSLEEKVEFYKVELAFEYIKSQILILEGSKKAKINALRDAEIALNKVNALAESRLAGWDVMTPTTPIDNSNWRENDTSASKISI